MIIFDHGYTRYLYPNSAWVSDQVLRQNHPTPLSVKKAARQGIATIINCRGENRNGSNLLSEEYCQKFGINLVYFRALSRAAPQKDLIHEAEKLFEDIQYPAMLHCKSGADRSGIMSALYLLIHLKRPVEEAQKELSWKFGHFRITKTGILDYFLESYARAHKLTGIGFLDWIDNEYDPDELERNFKAAKRASFCFPWRPPSKSQVNSMVEKSQLDSSQLLSRVWNDYLKSRFFMVILAVILMAINGGSIGLITYFVKPMIDEVFIAQDSEAKVYIAAILFGILAVRAVASFLQKTVIASLGLKVVADMQRDLSAHLMTLDTKFFSKNSPGNLIERVRGDTQTIQTVASSALIIMGRDTATLIALVVVAVSIDWKWTLFAFIGLPLLVLPVNFLHKLVRRATLKSRLAAAELSTRLDEIFHGIKAIKANRMEAHQESLAKAGIEDFRHRTFQAERGKAALPSIVDIIGGLGFVAVMIYGGQEIIDGDKTLGDFMAFFASLALLFDPIRRLAGVGGQLQSAAVSLDRIYELLDQSPEIVDSVDAVKMVNPGGDIEFRNLNFAYNENQPVLNGLNLVAESGKMTAVVGPSGAGKSTLFNLLSRFEEPQSGEILIGGQALQNILISDLRDSIALVTQETALFDESIYQNICCGRTDFSEAQVLHAAETALVTDFVADMPEGIHSSAGPRGSNLSGGQRQRVIIARALLRDLPILLLDEATSALDSNTEARIQQAMDSALEGKTSIVIAHRLSTVRKADKIYVMQDGKVVEEGSHEELMAKAGSYATMVSSLKD